MGRKGPRKFCVCGMQILDGGHRVWRKQRYVTGGVDGKIKLLRRKVTICTACLKEGVYSDGWQEPSRLREVNLGN